MQNTMPIARPVVTSCLGKLGISTTLLLLNVTEEWDPSTANVSTESSNHDFGWVRHVLIPQGLESTCVFRAVYLWVGAIINRKVRTEQILGGI